jgi:hypothetical protein
MSIDRVTGKHTRGTSNTNSRGNSAARRERRLWLISAWGGGYSSWGTVRCVFCGEWLDERTITVDRIIPGILEGGYRKGNIRPACMTCNSVEGSRLRDLLRGGADFFGRHFPDTGVKHLASRGRMQTGQLATIQFLLADGRMSQARIAREVGCSPISVRKIQRAHPASAVSGREDER